MEEGLAVLAMAPPAGTPGATSAEPFIRRLPNDPWGRPYLYVTPGEHGPYDLYSLGRDAQQGGEGADADIGSWQ
jgi:general secretion pathway protein G